MAGVQLVGHNSKIGLYKRAKNCKFALYCKEMAFQYS